MALAGAGLAPEVVSLGRIADALVVRLALEGVASLDAAEEAAVEGAYRTARALKTTGASWGWLRLEFVSPWRDALGNVEVRPHLVLMIPGPRLGKMTFENLTAHESFAQFEAEAPRYEGWKFWPGK